ncbi:MAG: 4'-phosphopantetheinyl transferase superfamily protein [Clostridia bacterium]|nr:4'-phosphopantetheinyl transferase superfamily protein [Clostridia bacterium]MBQ6467375.1 4'-phosphopantetheinyl transferase superfamily protein [Clostridia bacterium]
MKRNIYLLPINNDFNIVKYNNLLTFVSEKKITQLNELKNNMDKKLSLYAHIAVKLIIQKELSLDISKISIVYDDLGKPFVEDLENTFFSISHTYDMIAIAFSNSKVGIDIEKETENSVDIAKYFFTEKEKEYISVSCVNPQKAFLEIWTKKEAFIKYLGLGLRKRLDDFCVINDFLKDNFYTIQSDDYILSYYDGCNKAGIEIKNITEKEIEELRINS